VGASANKEAFVSLRDATATTKEPVNKPADAGDREGISGNSYRFSALSDNGTKGPLTARNRIR
jgi:hypothetical protein